MIQDVSPPLQLTDDSFWDRHWHGIKLPIQVVSAESTPYIKEILRIPMRYFPRDPDKSILEIGAAPGGYLAFMARTFGYRVFGIDNSSVGCQVLSKNFELLGIPVTIYRRDILHEGIGGLPTFDIVYSLGFIEHFTDIVPIVERHVELTKPNGMLLIGVPCFLGLNKLMMRALNPEYLSWHNLHAMDLRSWERFEHKLGLLPLFKGYVGGWEPTLYYKSSDCFWRRSTNAIIKTVAFTLDKFWFLHRVNSRWWSGYALAIYRRVAVS